ncbi:hypothetical protein O9368_04600 [Proteus mirabilis]|uniref:tail fiber/spike domain-containing protein n=1 Tax=Proteus mirabilis TaxID=584 RepID=UPI00257842DF|nr:hypothetical protein [Proteus mirabilis]MDM3686866.1 hypothetical protein [Proteus mirabilis]
MSTIPTLNPVPSEAAKDSKFNSGKIDEFVTSNNHFYTDRFGKKHYTIDGINYLSKQAMQNYGYITKKSFESGNTIINPNDVLLWESNGEYYRWDGELPKVVSAGSTPESAGGIGDEKWKSVGDATLRAELASQDGAKIIGVDNGITLHDFYSFYKEHDNPSFNTQHEASKYDGESNQIRVMGWKEFGDIGAGIFIIDPHQEYDTQDNPDRFKNTLTGKYWVRILDYSINPYIGLENASIIKASEKKNNSPWKQLAPINILGDSITYGYFSSYDGPQKTAKSYGGGLFYHSWTSIFARMMAAENGSQCYKGFIPLPLGYADDWDIFSQVSKIGNWSIKDDGHYASNLYNGATYQSSDNNAELVYKIPATFDEVQFFICKQPNGGQLTISLNGEIWKVIDTSSDGVTNEVIKTTMRSNKQGSMLVGFKKTDSTTNPVGISGIGIDNVKTFTSDTPRGGSVNQFSIPGRTLSSVSENVIRDCANNASALILALGFNDKNISYDSPENIQKRLDFSKRIDWVIKYCNQYNTPLIVPDFTWSLEPWRFTRRELRRAAMETGGVYIPLPDMLIKGRISTEDERTNRLRMWFDGAHPNRNGQQWIAEMIAKHLGLGCTTKKDAICNHDYWIALDLKDTWSNVNNTQNWNNASYKVCNGYIEVRGLLQKTDNSEISVTSHLITNNNELFRSEIKPPIFLSTVNKVTSFETKETENTPSVMSRLGYNGEFSIRMHKSGNKGISGSCVFEYSNYDA